MIQDISNKGMCNLFDMVFLLAGVSAILIVLVCLKKKKTLFLYIFIAK